MRYRSSLRWQNIKTHKYARVTTLWGASQSSWASFGGGEGTARIVQTADVLLRRDHSKPKDQRKLKLEQEIYLACLIVRSRCHNVNCSLRKTKFIVLIVLRTMKVSIKKKKVWGTQKHEVYVTVITRQLFVFVGPVPETHLPHSTLKGQLRSSVEKLLMTQKHGTLQRCSVLPLHMCLQHVRDLTRNEKIPKFHSLRVFHVITSLQEPSRKILWETI